MCRPSTADGYTSITRQSAITSAVIQLRLYRANRFSDNNRIKRDVNDLINASMAEMRSLRQPMGRQSIVSSIQNGCSMEPPTNHPKSLPVASGWLKFDSYST